MSIGLPQFPRSFVSKTLSSKISLSHQPRSLLGSTLSSWWGWLVVTEKSDAAATCLSLMDLNDTPQQRVWDMCWCPPERWAVYSLCHIFWPLVSGNGRNVEDKFLSFILPPIDFSLAGKSHRAELNLPAGKAVLLYGSSWCHDQHDNVSPCISFYLLSLLLFSLLSPL